MCIRDRSQARDEALAIIAKQGDLIPVGMAIGPFSLTTRLLKDPITLAAMAGTIVEAEDAGEVRLLWQCLRVSEAAVLSSVRSQIRHGAKAIMICEPAACKAFISPRQLKAGSNLFERLVMEPNLRLKAALEEAGCDLIFHDCGELIDSMVEAFAHRLHPVILSLGASRMLWEDALLTPQDVVLYEMCIRDRCGDPCFLGLCARRLEGGSGLRWRTACLLYTSRCV